ncbi:MAG: hypothetical protein ACJAZO_002818 [Myxococcota bacterium]|jgi:hypothetical protein
MFSTSTHWDRIHQSEPKTPTTCTQLPDRVDGSGHPRMHLGRVSTAGQPWTARPASASPRGGSPCHTCARLSRTKVPTAHSFPRHWSSQHYSLATLKSVVSSTISPSVPASAGRAGSRASMSSCSLSSSLPQVLMGACARSGGSSDLWSSALPRSPGARRYRLPLRRPVRSLGSRPTSFGPTFRGSSPRRHRLTAC